MLLSDLARERSQTRTAAPRRRRITTAAIAAALATVGSAGIAGPAMAAAHGHRYVQASQYAFTTVANPGDPTFNQLLGINNENQIAGYFGSGNAGHPNQGYTLDSSLMNFTGLNFPGSVQTQVTGLNDKGVTVGFWSDTNNDNLVNLNLGFYTMNGVSQSVMFPAASNSSPAVDQLLGVNNSDLAVGFYTDASGANHGFTYNIHTNRYQEVTVPNASSVQATAINNKFDIAGIYTDQSSGNTYGFLRTWAGRYITLAYPGASLTQAFGVNDEREVVGDYQIGTGDSATTHGFTWTPAGGFKSVDDPNGVGGTTVNGVNDAGDLVGFYTDAAGNVDGLVATPVPAP